MSKMGALLEINNLHVSYGAIKALKGVNIEVKEQSITAILGANGGGKSTLLKSISAIVPSEKGAIIFEGEDITKMSTEKITNKGIIHVPEGRQIFGELTVLENLRIGAFTAQAGEVPIKNVYPEFITPKMQGEINKKDKDDSTAKVHLTKKEMIKNNLMRVYDYFPVLKERKNQVALSLSGGEQQMLAIGRGLMSTPKLLILDEPTAGVDVEQRHDLWQYLKKLNQEGKTIILTSHYLEEIQYLCNEIAVINHGKIVAEGTKESFMKDGKSVEDTYLEITRTDNKKNHG